MKTQTERIASALRILARDIKTDDGVVNTCLEEAAGRLEELQRELTEAVRERNKTVANLIDQRDAAINAVIAEACGWKCAGHPDQLKATDGWEFGYQFVIQPDGQLLTHNSMPNYCNDLNAMHEAEKVLNTNAFFEKYYLTLYETTRSTRWPVCATARQRAEAFLRTLGKWEEVK